MNPRLTPKTCGCGAGFLGGSTARYCLTCRTERTRQRDRERHQRRLSGRIRPLGSTDKCALCGNEYTVNAGPQKHCPACQIAEAKRHSHEKFVRDYNDPVKRQKMLMRARQWALDNPERTAELFRRSYRRRIGERNERRRLRYGYKLRPLGRADICPRCDQNFTVLERNQKYCDLCRKNNRSP